MDTRHPDEGTIHAYVERQLSQAEHARVEAHVSGCAECAASVAEAHGLVAAASRIVAALDDVPANVIPVRTARRLPQWLAAAAVMVLAVGVSSVAVRSGLESRQDVPTMTAGAVDAQRQEGVPESHVSAEPEIPTAEGAAAANNPAVATGAAQGTSRKAVEPRTRIEAPVTQTDRRESPREEAVAFSAPAVSAQPVAPAAPPSAEADLAGASVGAAARDRATDPAVPTGRVAARAQSAPPRDAAALSLRQSPAMITGRVTNENGKPLAGANVYINELNASIGTDAAGRYALTIPSDRLGETAVVRARAIGYSPQSQPIELDSGSQTADFELRSELTQLSEVVVTGGTTTVAEQPMRTIRYLAAPGVIVELREFDAAARVPSAPRNVNEYHWSDATGSRRYVLSGSLPVAELRQLAGRLGELRIVR